MITAGSLLSSEDSSYSNGINIFTNRSIGYLRKFFCERSKRRRWSPHLRRAAPPIIEVWEKRSRFLNISLREHVINEKSLDFILKSIFKVNRPNLARPGTTVTYFDALYLRTYHRYGFQILSHCVHTVQNSSIKFPAIFSINVKMVAFLLNIDFRTFLDIFSLISQNLLRFFGIIFVSRERALKVGLESLQRCMQLWVVVHEKCVYRSISFQLFSTFSLSSPNYSKTTGFSLNLFRPYWRTLKHLPKSYKVSISFSGWTRV